MGLRDSFAKQVIATAFGLPPYAGTGVAQDRQYILQTCTHYFKTPKYIHRVGYTRDEGMHSSGWWKNPDYDRCLHLSISYLDAETSESAPQDKKESKRWCEIFFNSMVRLIWAEPPYSDTGKVSDVWHFRVFVAKDWRTPILPRGEVYSRKFTEGGWQSWSDLHAEVSEDAVDK